MTLPNIKDKTPTAATPNTIVNFDCSSFLFAICSSSSGWTSNRSEAKFKCFAPFALASTIAAIPRKNGIFFRVDSTLLRTRGNR
ncbi:Uncharacterised protein [Streptococcus pneumoniae]|nr:Uncharacterised protein [Streptococcus pneumoniae]CJH03666.1 Uncharacterised protein [Streptococcus pneumoniae]CJH95702.1 Uncharacterised protein [Streptococcus pneumoniae]CKE59020.1 Uncharacterised protein [Streptococcus pneumoniae]CKH12382.1 Uncharacterised protein [Streptococcus pneumoniae]